MGGTGWIRFDVRGRGSYRSRIRVVEVPGGRGSCRSWILMVEVRVVEVRMVEGPDGRSPDGRRSHRSSVAVDEICAGDLDASPPSARVVVRAFRPCVFGRPTRRPRVRTMVPVRPSDSCGRGHCADDGVRSVPGCGPRRRYVDAAERTATLSHTADRGARRRYSAVCSSLRARRQRMRIESGRLPERLPISKTTPGHRC